MKKQIILTLTKAAGNHFVTIFTERLQASTKNVIHSEQQQIERAYGIRYSILLELPYFDASRMCVVDPMHNLLLGTAKHMLELWKSLGILSSKQ